MSEMYTVESILDKRITKRKGIEYKVKWLGYDEEDSTWQPAQNLQYVKQMIQQYQNQNNSNKTLPLKMKQKQVLTYEEQSPQKIISQKSSEHVDAEADSFSQKNQQNCIPEQLEFDDQQEKDGEDEYLAGLQNQAQKEESSKNSEEDQEYKIQEIEEQQEQQRPKKKLQKSYVDSFKSVKKASKQKYNQHQTFKKVAQKKNKVYENEKNKVLVDEPAKKSFEMQRKNSIRETEERVRLIVKPPPKIPYTGQLTAPKPTSLTILSVATLPKSQKTALNSLIPQPQGLMFLTKQGDMVTYRTHQFLMQYPDELIRFYQSKIEFIKIPKLKM